MSLQGLLNALAYGLNPTVSEEWDKASERASERASHAFAARWWCCAVAALWLL